MFSMEFSLDIALKELTIEEGKPHVLKNLSEFNSCERNTRSIMGRLLNPDNQKMASMIHDMPRLWRVSNRARGIALSSDRFQFIFDNENDLQMVLDAGVWTYNDWPMALERWVENPPDDYLSTLPMWIRLRNIPVNHYTKAAIEEIGGLVGFVKEVAMDPLRPQSKGFIRVKIIFDIKKPLKSFKKIQLHTGEIVVVGVEYERIRKRCF